MKTFTIDYRVFTANRGTYHPPKMKVKNCHTELEAKIKLENYLKPKYTGFKRTEIISCVEDFMGGLLGDIFNGFRK